MARRQIDDRVERGFHFPFLYLIILCLSLSLSPSLFGHLEIVTIAQGPDVHAWTQARLLPKVKKKVPWDVRD